MKIAVSAKGNELSSQVDPRFGRAAYFIIYNTDDESFEAVSNDGAAAAQGAGIQAAQTVTNKHVDWVISGNMGPKAFAALKAAGMKIASWSDGTVEEAIKLVNNGELKEISGANVQGHWQQ
jgi:predicted Fe-Mo cluster-binding NifX family protein